MRKKQSHEYCVQNAYIYYIEAMALREIIKDNGVNIQEDELVEKMREIAGIKEGKQSKTKQPYYRGFE